MEDSRTFVVLLGTGNPNPDPDRSGPAAAVIVDDTPYLVDFGPGVVRRASAAYYRGVYPLRVWNIRHAFLTHFHSDHSVGYPDLIFTPWVMGRDEPLEVYGPPGLEHMTSHVLEAWAEDIKIRTSGIEPREDDGWRVNAHEVLPGVIFEDERVTVEAFKVAHGSVEHAYAYKFVSEDRTIVISGDTTYSDVMVEKAKGVDILIHEVYSAKGLDLRSEEWREYHSTFHTSSVELARIANAAKPKLLVMYHQLAMGVTDEELYEEVTELYDGPVIYGEDLDIF